MTNRTAILIGHDMPTVLDRETAAKKIKGIQPRDLHCVRTCGCKPTHINCLTPKDWMKSQLGVWEFYYEKRDI